jgi:diaminopimelate decarboxylase
VAQAGALVARVLQVKRNGKKTFVITDAAMNDLIRPALYQAHHEIVPVRPRGGRPGCGCGGAGLRDGRLFCAGPEAGATWSRATWWRCSMHGAYGMAQSSNYNTRPRPAEVLVRARRRG